MARKFSRHSEISAEMEPVLFRLAALRALTKGARAVVRNAMSRAGARAAAPNRGWRLSMKTAEPTIVKNEPANCISDWEKNWFSLSVSLLSRETRSPDWCCWKKATGNS